MCYFCDNSMKAGLALILKDVFAERFADKQAIPCYVDFWCC